MHIVDIGGPVEVFGLGIVNGDLVHADRHGAVLIEPKYLHALPACIDLVQRKEAPLLAAARNSSFDLAALERAMHAGEDIH